MSGVFFADNSVVIVSATMKLDQNLERQAYGILWYTISITRHVHS